MNEVLVMNGVSYVERTKSNAQLVAQAIPKAGQTVQPLNQVQIDSRTYKLNHRNAAGTALIPINEPETWLNFIPQKVVVTDGAIVNFLDPTFDYFAAEVIPAPEPYRLADGLIFRCVSETPLPKEQYKYYLVEEGKGRPIPNYLTLEVMLAERNQTMLSIRVLEESQCEQMPKDGEPMPDLTTSWKEEYEDQSNFQKLKELEVKAKDGAAQAEAAKAEAASQIAAVKALAEQSKAEAEAAKAEAEAAKAQAEADKASADAAKAEADAKKAELDAKLQGL
jgi:hypothetical protein